MKVATKEYGAHSIIHHAIELVGFVDNPVHGVGFLGKNMISGDYEVYFQQPEDKLKSNTAKKMSKRYGPQEWRDGFRTGRDKNKAVPGCAMIASWVFSCDSCPSMPVDVDGAVVDAKVYMSELFKHYARPRCGTVFVDSRHSNTGEPVYQRLYIQDWKNLPEEFSSPGDALKAIRESSGRSYILQFLDDVGNPVGGVFVPNQWRRESLPGADVAVDMLTRISYRGKVTPESVLSLRTPIRLLLLEDYELSTCGKMPAKADEWFCGISQAGKKYPICRTTICSISEMADNGRYYINDMWPFLKDTKRPPLDFDDKNERVGFYPEFQNMVPSAQRIPLQEWLPRKGAVSLRTSSNPNWDILSTQAKNVLEKCEGPRPMTEAPGC